MKFKPSHGIIFNGRYLKSGEVFDIEDPSPIARYGKIIAEKIIEAESQAPTSQAAPKPRKKKGE